MENFKIKNFNDFYKGNLSFPKYKKLSNKKLSTIQKKLLSQLHLSEDSDSDILLSLIKAIQKKSVFIENYNAQEENFSLDQLFNSLKINTLPQVYINWYRFDDVDEINFKDFCKYFDDIWYPSSDDIDLFDDSYNWIITITHSGEIYKTVFK